jgi:hypothetical protein
MEERDGGREKRNKDEGKEMREEENGCEGG